MTKTPNIGLNLPVFDNSPWHDEVNHNFRALDATINSVMGISNLKGAYVNSTAVVAGERYFDDATGQYYEALSNFTTMAAPNTFATERSTYPDRWGLLDSSLAEDYLQRAQNLSDVADAAVARTNLGLGTAAEEDVEAFATAAQGDTADTAIQPTTHERSFRNLIINGDFRINQRGAGSKAQAVGVYGYDRWKGHADGLEQVVEQAMVPAGTYTLSWSGGGNGRLNGGSLLPSPITASLPGTGNVSVVVPATATDVQLELGGVATPFERRPQALEWTLCARYFWAITDNFYAYALSAASNLRAVTFYFPVEMRVVPTATITGSTMSISDATTTSLIAFRNVGDTSTSLYLTDATFDAEL